MYTIESFCNAVFEIPYIKITQMINKDLYTEFRIPKKNGFRTINYLNKKSDLWNLQHKLLINFLNKQSLPTCVKGFLHGESYHSFLYEHIDSKFFLRIDISSFFQSITTNQIKNEISRLIFCNSKEDKNKLLDLICDITTLHDSIPQGACSSPSISNIVMARIDQRITKFCQAYNTKYTRYADDLLFSSKNFDFKQKKWFLKKIKYILSSQNLQLNYSKTKYGIDKLIINGYIISDNGISLSRQRLSDIRHTISFAKENQNFYRSKGKDKFLEKLNNLNLKHRNLVQYPFKTIFQFVQYMCGYRAFLISLLDQNYSYTTFQKQLKKLINKLELQILYYT